MTFGATFYPALLAGNSLGDAVLKARNEIYAKQLLDWADYIHYGDYQFCIKLPQ
jgi:hypothetical protein